MRRRFATAICIMVGMALAWVGTCEAQQLKIAFVDLQQFALKSERAKAQQQRFIQLVAKKRAALEKKQQELRSLQEQLQKQGPMLKEEMRTAKIKEIGIKEMELKLAEKEAENAVRNERREAEEVFQRDIIKVTSAIRKQKGLDLVLNAAALLSAEDALNITKDVVRAYDAQKSAPRAGAAAGKAKPRAKARSKAAPRRPAPAPRQRAPQ